MEGSRNMVAVSFALIVIALYLIACMYIVNPFLRKNFITLDDAVALYVDTLASVEKGTVKIPVESGTVNRVEIAYKEKGEEKDIKEKGWYVIVTYRLLGEKTEKSASRINSYPKGAELDTSIFSPVSVCITKERGAEHPRVSKC